MTYILPAADDVTGRFASPIIEDRIALGEAGGPLASIVGTVDPRAGGGVEAPVGTRYVSSPAVVGVDEWLKVGPGDTDWRPVGGRIGRRDVSSWVTGDCDITRLGARDTVLTITTDYIHITGLIGSIRAGSAAAGEDRGSMPVRILDLPGWLPASTAPLSATAVSTDGASIYPMTVDIGVSGPDRYLILALSDPTAGLGNWTAGSNIVSLSAVTLLREGAWPTAADLPPAL